MLKVGSNKKLDPPPPHPNPLPPSSNLPFNERKIDGKGENENTTKRKTKHHHRPNKEKKDFENKNKKREGETSCVNILTPPTPKKNVFRFYIWFTNATFVFVYFSRAINSSTGKNNTSSLLAEEYVSYIIYEYYSY